jgi:aspartyl-tRNA synthetase
VQQRGIDPANFEFYLEAFRYGMPPHEGLAIGAERLTMQLLGLQNIREATLFPRDRTRLTP